MHTPTYIHTRMHRPTYTHACMHTPTFTHIHAHACTHAYTHMHAHTHTHIHTHAHTQKHSITHPCPLLLISMPGNGAMLPKQQQHCPIELLLLFLTPFICMFYLRLFNLKCTVMISLFTLYNLSLQCM